MKGEETEESEETEEAELTEMLKERTEFGTLQILTPDAVVCQV